MYGLRIYGNQNYVDNSMLYDLPEKSNFAIRMNRFKNFIEWNAFGVCTAIGDRLGIATSKIRQFFIYASILTMGSPVIIYLVLAFWRNIRKYIWAAKRNPWYYL
jgi:phage shock protein PspC (stress-responsive transcriptional regulator)